jgi:hypothetical protein
VEEGAMGVRETIGRLANLKSKPAQHKHP